MRRALLAVVALLAVLAASVQASSADAQTAEPQIAAASWYLVGDDGSVLARSDAGRERAIASITKLMTAVVVLESAQLDRRRAREPARREHRRVDRVPPCGRGADGRGSAARDAHPERERRRRGARASRRPRFCRSFRPAHECQSRGARSHRHALREPTRARRAGARLERARRDDARALRARSPVHPRRAVSLERRAAGRQVLPDDRRPARGAGRRSSAGRPGTRATPAGRRRPRPRERGVTVYGTVLGSDSRGSAERGAPRAPRVRPRPVPARAGDRPRSRVCGGDDGVRTARRPARRAAHDRAGRCGTGSRSSSASSRRRRSRFPWRRESASAGWRSTTATGWSRRRTSSPRSRSPRQVSSRRRRGTRPRPRRTSGG